MASKQLCLKSFARYMQPPLPNAKAALREEIRTRLKAITPAHRAVESAQLCARLSTADIWRGAKAVLLFAPLADEPDLWPILEYALHEHKLVALPGFDGEVDGYCARRVNNPSKDLIPGKFGVPEPSSECPTVPLNQLDLILVPGVAFDSSRRRLGRGKGFYDRLLPLVSGFKCGVAYDEQIVAEVPAEPHDVTLNRILTPTRWV